MNTFSHHLGTHKPACKKKMAHFHQLRHQYQTVIKYLHWLHVSEMKLNTIWYGEAFYTGLLRSSATKRHAGTFQIPVSQKYNLIRLSWKVFISLAEIVLLMVKRNFYVLIRAMKRRYIQLWKTMLQHSPWKLSRFAWVNKGISKGKVQKMSSPRSILC